MHAYKKTATSQPLFTNINKLLLFSSPRALTHRPRTVHALPTGGARGGVGCRPGDGSEGAHWARAVEVSGGTHRGDRLQKRVARRERAGVLQVPLTEIITGAQLANVVGDRRVRGVRPLPRGAVAGGETGGGSSRWPVGFQRTASARIAPRIVLVRPWQTQTAGPPVGPGVSGVAGAIHRVAAQPWGRRVGRAVVFLPHVAPGPWGATVTRLVEFSRIPLIAIARHVRNRLRRADGLGRTAGYFRVPLAPAVRRALHTRTP